MGIEYDPPVPKESLLAEMRDVATVLYRRLVEVSVAMKWIDHLRTGDGQNPPARLTEQERRDQHLVYMAGFAKPESAPTEAMRRVRKTADSINQLLSANDIRYMLVVQPIKGCGTKAMNDLPKDGSVDTRDQFLCRTFRNAWRETGEPAFPTLDASIPIADRLEAEGQFGDPVHLWDEGFELLNATVVEFIKRELSTAG
jgi:hypothetical protein